MAKRYRSFFYILDVLILRIPLRRKVKAAKLLAGMSLLPFRPIALTCAGRTDGGGAQIHAAISVKAFCEAFGYRYVHTSMQSVEHTSSDAEVSQWEDLFGLGVGECLAPDAGYPVAPARYYVSSPRHWLRRVVVAMEDAHHYTNSNPAAFLKIKDRLQRTYSGHPIERENGRIVVAVHIRRGDVTKSAASKRFTDDRVIVGRIYAIRRALGEAADTIEVVIHSQGHPEQFKMFTELGCRLDLNESPLNSLNAMVNADILLTAKSSFSYVAGILSRGVVIYEPFWHPPLPDWLDGNEITPGCFDTIRLPAR